MENIFSILYKYKPQPNMTPEENYFTESLKFILSLDSSLCNKFIKLISNGNKFNSPFIVSSQVRHGSSIIDLELTDKNRKKIFIEVKLRARENSYLSEDGNDSFGQVEKYLKLNTGYVCFISQGSDDIDIKTNKDKYLGQFEWFQIYEIIDEYRKSNNLKEFNLYFINSFLNFMKQLDMQPFQGFTKQEIRDSQSSVFGFYSKLCDFLDYAQKDKRLFKFFKENGFLSSVSSAYNKWRIAELQLKKKEWRRGEIGFGFFYANSDNSDKYKGNEGVYYYTYAETLITDDAKKIKDKYKKFNLNKKYFQTEFNEEEIRQVALNVIPFYELIKDGKEKAIDYIYESLLELKNKGVIKAIDWAMKKEIN